MPGEVCRFLRPFLHRRVRPRAHPAYARFFSACSGLSAQNEANTKPRFTDASLDYEKRVAKLQSYTNLGQCYPRLVAEPNAVPTVSVKAIREQSERLENGVTDATQTLTVSGRVRAVRTAGSRLAFIDVELDGQIVQAICNLGVLQQHGVGTEHYKAFRLIIRKGDWYSFTGNPHKASAGEPSLMAVRLPQLISPSLHQLPKQLDNLTTKARRPHVDMLVNPEVLQTLRMRSYIERHVASFLESLDFLRVNTPLLTAGAGGAVARPFETVATELESTKLNLRIAPELWLKRLVVGGLGRVYEMGPAFRNEGVDATHNPEFTMCEFYMPFANLDHLMSTTEDILSSLYQEIRKFGKSTFNALPNSIVDFDGEGHTSLLAAPFARLPFIPRLEQEMGRQLPNLGDPTAPQQLLALFSDLKLPVPANATLPRLLDALATAYLEPLCDKPTFITTHPAVMSPLAKSYICPDTNQLVSARAELFIHGNEYANMYEEENSPFEQRKKLMEQLKYRAIDGEGDGVAQVDESYLEALEWGLPPTGGWGMGIDRLVMLFTGQKRIGHVLPFGTLRNVVGLSQRQK